MHSREFAFLRRRLIITYALVGICSLFFLPILIFAEFSLSENDGLLGGIITWWRSVSDKVFVKFLNVLVLVTEYFLFLLK